MGKAVDERTDIWAFGCLLYELLTGRRAFPGEDLSGTIAAVLEREPDWTILPGATPTSIRELLRRCLHKDPTRRLQNIVDARKTIERAQRGRNRWKIAAIAAAALAVLAIGGAVWSRGPAPAPNRSEWVQITRLPDSVSQPALSPDGRMLTFIRGPATFFGPGQVYVKMLPDGEPVQLTNDNLAKMRPVFSPDGTRIAYTVVGPEVSLGHLGRPRAGRRTATMAAKRLRTGLDRSAAGDVCGDQDSLPTWGLSRPTRGGSGSVMSTCPRMNMPWRTCPTRHPTENGCSS